MEKMGKYLTKDRQKQRNLSDILRFILQKGTTTRREIERETGFSWGAVSESVTELIARGYVHEEMPSEKSVGRTSSVLKLSGDSIVSVGIDINVSGIVARIIGFDRSRKWKKTIPCTATTQDELFEAAIDVCGEAFSLCEEKYRVISIGIAIQGTVDTENGISIHFPGIPNWQTINIKEMFEERFGVFTTVEHDPKCLLFAKNSSAKLRDALLLRIDNGIGLSVIQDGSILNDFGRMEIGHTIAVYNGERCTCGKRGCLEAYSSIPGIEHRSGKQYSDIVREGSADIFAEASLHLSRAVYNLTMLFRPEKIILTGILSENESFVKCFTDAFFAIEDAGCEIEVDNNISASMGAALLSIMNLLKTNNI